MTIVPSIELIPLIRQNIVALFPASTRRHRKVSGRRGNIIKHRRSFKEIAKLNTFLYWFQNFDWTTEQFSEGFSWQDRPRSFLKCLERRHTHFFKTWSLLLLFSVITDDLYKLDLDDFRRFHNVFRRLIAIFRLDNDYNYIMFVVRTSGAFKYHVFLKSACSDRKSSSHCVAFLGYHSNLCSNTSIVLHYQQQLWHKIANPHLSPSY